MSTQDDLQKYLDEEENRRVRDLPDLGAFAWKPNRLPLVLLGQIQRSGGTLLTRLLDGHPGLHVYPHELHWNKHDETQWPDISPDSADGEEIFDYLAARHLRQLRRFAHYGYDKFGRSRNGEPLPHLFNLALHKRLFLDAYPRLTTQRDALRAYLASFFGAWLDYRDRYVPDKRWYVAFGKRHNFGNTPNRFFEDFPDGRFITLIRRPDDWLASATSHQPQTYREEGTALRTWRESAEASLRLVTAYPDRALLVTFERLVTNTKGTLTRIFRWLELDASESDFEPTFNQMPVHSNSSFKPSRGVDTSTVGRGSWIDVSGLDECLAFYSEATTRYIRSSPNAR